MGTTRREHWDDVYATRGETGVSWHEDDPAPSLALIEAAGAGAGARIIDVGGGASRLVDRLLEVGARVTVLDLSVAATEAAQDRLGEDAARVRWIAADVTGWTPDGEYDLWHDRAAFHFLAGAADRAAYVERLAAAVRQGGHAVIATFAADGPERCSGLPVVRYAPDGLAEAVGPAFEPVDSRPHVHLTPAGVRQSFQYSLFRRV